MAGWIKLHREIKNKSIYQQPPLYLRVFERLIIEANSRCARIPYGKETKLVKRGERLTSIGQIAEWIGWYERGIFKIPNKKTISDILDWLIKNELIEIFNKGNARETHYNIVNYCIYQSRDDDESNAKVTPDKRPLDTNKKYKELKEVKENKVINICGANPPPKFIPPTLEEVIAYCNERKNGIDAETWIDHYTANGWMVGKNKMKDWKACVRKWEKSDFRQKPTGTSGNIFFDMLKEEGKL